MNAAFQGLGMLGTLTVLTSYGLTQRGTLAAQGRAQAGLNLLGSAAVALSAWPSHQAAVLVLEGGWALVSAAGLWRAWRQAGRPGSKFPASGGDAG